MRGTSGLEGLQIQPRLSWEKVGHIFSCFRVNSLSFASYVNPWALLSLYSNMWWDSTDGRAADSGNRGPGFKSNRWQFFCAMLQGVTSNRVCKNNTVKVGEYDRWSWVVGLGSRISSLSLSHDIYEKEQIIMQYLIFTN